MPRRTALLLALSLLMAVVNIAGGFLGLELVRTAAQWLYLPPLMAALWLETGLRTPRSRWWLAGLVLCWLGDGLGGTAFLVLLGLFLLGHLAYLVALWPTRQRSWAWRPAGLLHVALLTLGLLLVLPVSGGLWPAVVAYGVVLTTMALLATTAGPAGVVGGLLFMVSDLSLGRLVLGGTDLGDGWRALLVIGTYVPAQVLLLVGVLRLERAADQEERRVARRSTAYR
jgi:uncharacterized membrane protein YhhN